MFKTALILALAAPAAAAELKTVVEGQRKLQAVTYYAPTAAAVAPAPPGPGNKTSLQQGAANPKPPSRPTHVGGVRPFEDKLGYLLRDDANAKNTCGCLQMNGYGFGSDLHTYGNAMWNAKVTRGSSCVALASKNGGPSAWIWDPAKEIFDFDQERGSRCNDRWVNYIRDGNLDKRTGLHKRLRRAASTQFIFSKLRQAVYAAAAETQAFRAFREGVLRVSVHVRWGDKGTEMKIKPIETYVELTQKLTGNARGPVDVFLTTEDPKAVEAFREAAPDNWKIILYEPALQHNGHPASEAHRDKRAGWNSMIALVLAMQSDKLVITSGSNWGRLMEELCLGRFPRCTIADASPERPSDWRK